MSTGDEKLRAMIDQHLDPDNDPSALPPAECRDVCSKCSNVYCVAEPVY